MNVNFPTRLKRARCLENSARQWPRLLDVLEKHRDDRSEILQRLRPYDSVRALFSSEECGREALDPAGTTGTKRSDGARRDRESATGPAGGSAQ